MLQMSPCEHKLDPKATAALPRFQSWAPCKYISDMELQGSPTCSRLNYLHVSLIQMVLRGSEAQGSIRLSVVVH